MNLSSRKSYEASRAVWELSPATKLQSLSVNGLDSCIPKTIRLSMTADTNLAPLFDRTQKKIYTIRFIYSGAGYFVKLSHTLTALSSRRINRCQSPSLTNNLEQKIRKGRFIAFMTCQCSSNTFLKRRFLAYQVSKKFIWRQTSNSENLMLSITVLSRLRKLDTRTGVANLKKVTKRRSLWRRRVFIDQTLLQE